MKNIPTNKGNLYLVVIELIQGTAWVNTPMIAFKDTKIMTIKTLKSLQIGEQESVFFYTAKGHHMLGSGCTIWEAWEKYRNI